MTSELDPNRAAYSLDTLRNVLVRLEDTIVTALIERAQYARNAPIYDAQAEPFASIQDGGGLSFVRYLLREMERVHARVRRYTAPEEHPFTPIAQLPAPILPPLDGNTSSTSTRSLLHANTVNLNERLYRVYVEQVVPAITAGQQREVDDQNYGSTATRDVHVLQEMSKRIHYGKFIAEAKFNDPKWHDTYVALIKERDRAGLMRLLTDEAVEARLLERLRRKAGVYGQDFSNEGRARVPVDAVVDTYARWIIPLTKEVQVEYLMQRLDGVDAE